MKILCNVAHTIDSKGMPGLVTFTIFFYIICDLTENRTNKKTLKDEENAINNKVIVADF